MPPHSILNSPSIPDQRNGRCVFRAGDGFEWLDHRAVGAGDDEVDGWVGR